LFHTASSPYYARTIAEVWFCTEDDAKRAGFTGWVRKSRSKR
jgi:large subunit ribosomal protein L4